MLTPYLSNQPDILINQLVDHLATHPPKDIFRAPQIIVPHAALKREISLAIANRLGICANINFSFLSKWLWEHAQITTDAPKFPPLSIEVLQWRIFKLIDTVKDPSGRLSDYLKASDPLMKFELSARLAVLFTQYSHSRHEWLQTWAKEEHIAFPQADVKQTTRDDEAWQADLWYKIIQDSTADIQLTAGLPLAHFIQVIQKDGIRDFENMPDALHIFIDYDIDALQMQALEALSEHIDIALYIFSPCGEYWEDIIDLQKYLELKKENRLDDYQTVGNPLLASWGKPARLFAQTIVEQPLMTPLYQENPENTYLAHIQNNILSLSDEPFDINAEDDSLQIHVAHSLAREIEILHDQLLALFNRHPEITPDRVAVFTPQLDAAAPLIEAVFAQKTGTQALPYVISGRRNTAENPVSRAFMQLLDLAQSRVFASDMLDVLSLPEIGNTFGFNSNDIDVLQHWFNVTNTCWALNGEHKAQYDLPNDNRFTIDEGIERLLLSYAFDTDTPIPIDGVFAIGNIGGTQTEQLAQFCHFTDLLAQLKQKTACMQTPATWRDTWRWVMDNFLTVSRENAYQEELVLQRIDDLFGAINQAFNGIDTLEISFDVAKQSLQTALDHANTGSVPAGSIVFTGMSDLRYIAYDHIFVIGLDSSVFPNTQRKDEFDLTASLPNGKDFTKRDWDKYIFLSILLNARKHLYISYCGRDIRNNAEISQSIVLSELLSTLTSHLPDNDAREKLLEQIITDHPLQTFSERYFDGQNPKLFSFRDDLCQAIEKRLSQSSVSIDNQLENDTDDENDEQAKSLYKQKHFIPEDFLFALDESFDRNIDLSQLKAFFDNPARYFLRNRLGVHFAYEEETPNEYEPINFENLAQKRFIERLIPLYLAGMSNEEIEAIAQASPEKPLGFMGETQVKTLCCELEAFTNQFKDTFNQTILPDIQTTLNFEKQSPEAWTLFGTLNHISTTGLLYYSYENMHEKQKLDLWIDHLFLNACGDTSTQRISKAYFKDTTICLAPIEQHKAQFYLQNMLKLFEMGMQKPLLFFKKTSAAYWEKAQNSDSPYDEQALKKAMKEFSTSIYPENKNDYIALVTRGFDNLLADFEEEFSRNAKCIYEPLFEHFNNTSSQS